MIEYDCFLTRKQATGSTTYTLGRVTFQCDLRKGMIITFNDFAMFLLKKKNPELRDKLITRYNVSEVYECDGMHAVFLIE